MFLELQDLQPAGDTAARILGEAAAHPRGACLVPAEMAGFLLCVRRAAFALDTYNAWLGARSNQEFERFHRCKFRNG